MFHGEGNSYLLTAMVMHIVGMSGTRAVAGHYVPMYISRYATTLYDTTASIDATLYGTKRPSTGLSLVWVPRRTVLNVLHT